MEDALWSNFSIKTSVIPELMIGKAACLIDPRIPINMDILLLIKNCHAIPNNTMISIGRAFKMKSKRYLDVCNRCETYLIESNPSNESSSSLLSTFTFGLFGSNSNATNTRRLSNPSIYSNSSSPTPSMSQSSISQAQMQALTNSLISLSPADINDTNNQSKISIKPPSNYGELLFVQDRSFLIIVKPETHNSKSIAVTPDKLKGNH